MSSALSDQARRAAGSTPSPDERARARTLARIRAEDINRHIRDIVGPPCHAKSLPGHRGDATSSWVVRLS